MKAWAVFTLPRNKVAHWATGESGLEQYDIFTNHDDAEQAKKEWEASTAEGFEVKRVEVTLCQK